VTERKPDKWEVYNLAVAEANRQMIEWRREALERHRDRLKEAEECYKAEMQSAYAQHKALIDKALSEAKGR